MYDIHKCMLTSPEAREITLEECVFRKRRKINERRVNNKMASLGFPGVVKIEPNAALNGVIDSL